MIQFVRPTPYGRPMSLNDLFVAKGETFAAALMVSDITDVIFSVPTGWIVEEGEVTSSSRGTQYALSIKAPSYEDVISKSAAQGGYIKVIGVCEGGKTITAKLYVSCSPFATFKVSKNCVNITEYYGWDMMFYGIAKVDEFDEDAIMSTIMSEMADPNNFRFTYESFGPGSFYEPVPIENLLEDFAFTHGEQYVMWTVPVMTDADTYQFYCVENTIETCEFVYRDINVETIETTILDINLNVEMKGVDKYFAGLVSHSYYYNGFSMDEVLNEFNYCLRAGEDYYHYPDVYTYSNVYEGSVSEFITVDEGHDILPNGTYTLWIAPYVEGKTSYTLDELYTFDFTTAGLQYDESLSLNVNYEKVTPDNLVYNAIHVKVEANDAALMYYCWVNPEDLPLIPNVEEYVLNNGQIAGSTVTATTAGLTPNTPMTLLVVAVASDGKYGRVSPQSFATSEYEYNSMVTTIQVVGTPSVDGTTISLSSDGEATQYIYWVGKSDDSCWLNTFGGTIEKFEAYVVTSPESYKLKKVSSSDASAINISTTEYGKYLIAAVAVNSDGVISHAVQYNFSVEYPLGNFVAGKDANGNENAEWAAKRPTVTIETETVGDFTHVSWSVTNVPDGFTAKTAICHDDNLTNYPTGKDVANYFLTDEYVELEDVAASEDTHMNPYASPGYNVWVILCDAEGNYYEPYKFECNIQGGGGFAQ